MRHLQRMAASGAAAGLGVEGLLAQAGLGPEQLSHVDGMVPLAAVEIMLAALQRHYGDPLLGLHGANEIQPNTLGALGHILQACSTFGDILDVVVRYNGMLSNIGHVSVSHAPGLVQLHWACLAGSPLFRRHASEYVIGTVAVLTRLLAPGAASLPTAVHFSHARPDNAERVREYFDFFRCPVLFDQPSASITFPATLLQVRLPYGDAVLKDLLEQHARNLLIQRGQAASIEDDVRRLVKALVLQGASSKEAVAEQLGISARSLHRRLQEVGTSYRDIVDATRLSQACEQLSSSDAPVGDIADRLGFSSRQAFMRWFRQQLGITPSQYRHTQKAP
jgi:AraC-like DNA-binding protein